MYCIKSITKDIAWIGGNDRRPPFFEGTYPVPEGVSYNSYLISDEKTLLIDTADKAIRIQFLENLDHALAGRQLDYIFIEHMEPDHCSVLVDVLKNHPETTVLASAMALNMVKQFFALDLSSRAKAVKEGDSVSLGSKTLTFTAAQMVHWPEVMMGYLAPDGVLFSADAFGTFGAVGGSIFTSDMDLDLEWLPEARRYYTNIVGKYGPQVMSVLKKAAALDISLICPLHGPVINENIGYFVDKYTAWATYTPETDGVLIAFASVYGDTANAAEILAGKLYDREVKKTAVYDVSITHPSYILAEAFRYSNIVLASTTYNTEIFETMQPVVNDMKAHALKNRKFSIIENGSWAPTAGKLIREAVGSLPGAEIIEPVITIKSALREDQLKDLDALADNIAASLVPAGQEDEAEASKNLKKWKCKICGYEYEGEELPEDFKCPVCKRPASDFEEITPEPEEPKPLKKWKCKICGYEYEGEELPEDFKCPVCKRPASDFEEVTPEPEEPKPLKKWKCKICGYEYEGEELPEDFKCPVCKRPASDFEPVN